MTAQLNAGDDEGSPNCANVCCDAPRAGVLVVAPHNTPAMSESGMPKPKLNPTAIDVPRTITAKLNILSLTPPERNALMNPGPTCNPSE